MIPFSRRSLLHPVFTDVPAAKRPQFLPPALLSVLSLLAALLVLALPERCAVPAAAAVVSEGQKIFSANGAEDYAAEAEARKSEPIQSNADPLWPQGPEITAEGACLMDADTGVVLYNKNMDEPLYPASTTKLMTCLIAAQELSLSDTVTISEAAVSAVPAGSSNIGMDIGESITVEQALYGILVGSANEVSNAVAEKVSGSIEAFVDRMNQKAAELGCTHTHFVTTNGLHDEDHYTTAHDLALIARAFFENEVCARIGNTPRCHFEATASQPDDFWLNNKHELITGATPYEGILGGKTGYTGNARQTLVTACRQGSMTLIAVVLKCESPSQYSGTAALFDYGFHNFTELGVAQNETRFANAASVFLESGSSPLAESGPVFSLSEDSRVTVPSRAGFAELVAELAADPENQSFALIQYRYGSTPVGSARLYLNPLKESTLQDISPCGTDAESLSRFVRLRHRILQFSRQLVHRSRGGSVYVNVRACTAAFSLLAGAILLLQLLINYIQSYTRPGRTRRRRWKRIENTGSIGGWRRFPSDRDN